MLSDEGIMEDVLKAVEELKAQVSILSNDNGSNKVKILVLETRLSSSLDKIKELEGRANRPPSGIGNDIKRDQSFQALQRKVAHLQQQQKQQQQQQQQQVQDANERFKRVDSLKNLISGVILEKIKAQETASKMESLESRITSIAKLHGKFDARLSDSEGTVGRFVDHMKDIKEQMESLESKISSIETVHGDFNANLLDSKRKAGRFEENLQDVKKRMDSFDARLSNSEQLSERFEDMEEKLHRNFNAGILDSKKKAERMEYKSEEMKKQMDSFDARLCHSEEVAERVEDIEKRLHRNFNASLLESKKKAERIEHKLEEMKEQMDSFDARFSNSKQVAERFEDMEEQMDSFDTRLSNSEEVVGRFEDMEKQMDSFDTRLSNSEQVAERIEDMEEQMESVKSKIFSFEEIHGNLDAHLSDTDGKVAHLEENLKDTKKQMDDMKSKYDLMYEYLGKIKLDDVKGKCDMMYEYLGKIMLDDLKRKCDMMYEHLGRIMLDDLKRKCDRMYEHLEKRPEFEFTSSLKQVKDHRVLLGYNDYREMAALEDIAGVPDGPAFKFLINCTDGNSKQADTNRQYNVNWFQNSGIESPVLAMEEYNKRCHERAGFAAETEFHPIWAGDYVHYILAVDQSCLRFLDRDTKKENKSWAWTDITTCEDDGHWIELTFTDGNTTKFSTHERISEYLCQTIGSRLGKGDSGVKE